MSHLRFDKLPRRCDVVPMEEAVHGVGGFRDPSVEETGRREPPVETAGGESDVRQEDATGCAVKKAPRPAVRRDLVRKMIAAYRTSERA